MEEEDFPVRSNQVTVLDSLLTNFKQLDNKPALNWLDQHCNVVESYSYVQLGVRTLEIARGLLSAAEGKSCPSQPVAVLCYPPGLDFILNFIGCLRAGFIPVPVKSPEECKTLYRKTLFRILEDCNATFVLSQQHFLEELLENQEERTSNYMATLLKSCTAEWLYEQEPIQWSSGVSSQRKSPECTREGTKPEKDCSSPEEEEIRSKCGEELEKAEEDKVLDKAQGQDVAFLLYANSENPKGVMITYQNLLHSFHIMRNLYATNSSTKEICLLPHFNGFAVVGSYLHMLCEGATGYFVAPKTLYDHPGVWVEAMSKFKLTHSKVPCSVFVDSLLSEYSGDMNLESVVCIACVEPVSCKSLDRFNEYMCRFGMRRNAVSAGYGVAEHVGVVCSPSVAGPSTDESRLVVLNRLDCGKPCPGVQVKIVDQLGHCEVSEGTIGEVWVSGESKAAGYFNNQQATLDVFNARIRGEPEGSLYLRTGDLGFMRDGRLFVCEKLADVLTIQDDHCIYPLDIEMAAESAVSEIRQGKTIAFHYSPLQHSDEISILAELKPAEYTEEDYKQFETKITDLITRHFKRLFVHAVIFVKPFSVPSTLLGMRERELSRFLAHITELQLYNRLIKPKPFRWLSDKDKQAPAPRVAKKPTRKGLETKKRVLLTSPPNAHPSSPDGNILSPVPLHWRKQKQSSPKPSISMHSENDSEKFRDSSFSPEVLPTLAEMSPDARSLSRSPRSLSPARRHTDCPDTSTPVKSPPMTPATPCSPGLLEVSPPRSFHASVSSPVLSQEKSPPLPKSPTLMESKFSTASDISDTFTILSHFDNMHSDWKRLRSRRQSAPPFPVTSPITARRRKKRAKSLADEFIGKSSLDGLLHALSRRMGHTIHAGDKVWGNNSVQVDEIATMLQEDYGFHMSRETLVLAESPEDLLKAMKMSLLSTEVVAVEPFRMSFTTLPPPIFNPFLTRVYESECRLYLKNVEQYKHKDEEIAIVGMGGLFSGTSCNSIGELWDHMTDDKTASSQQGLPGTPKFDHEDYSIDDCDVSSLTPSEKLLLQAVRRCLFNAGFTDSPDCSGSNWGVFAALPQDTDATASCIAGIYNLTGPTMEMKTTHGSLSPLSTACLHLQSKNCDAAIVCGVEETVMSAISALRYSYCAALLLMSVGKAKKFNRRILAVIKATSCNNQGGGYSTVYTPNRASQTQLLKRTIAKANLAPSEVSYVEADGKGGSEKRSLEMDCVQEVLGSKSGNPSSTVVISSLKANIGDLGAVSSIVSVIKATMVMQHAQVPRTLPSKLVATPTDKQRSDNLDCFPVAMTPLSSAKYGKLLSAVVNCFEDTGRNEVAVIQQYGILPHLAGVSTWLVLAADHIVTDKVWPEEVERQASFYKETIEALKTQIPVFANAFTCFTKVFDATVKRYNFDSVELLAARNKVMVLKLYYSFMAQFFSSGLAIPVIGTTNAMNEVAALLFAGAIDLSTAILFLCCKHVSIKVHDKPTRYKIGPHKLIKLMRTPKIQIFSCIQQERLSEDIFTDKARLSQYVFKLCDSIGQTRLPCILYKILLSKGPAKPLVYIDTVDKSREGHQRKHLITIAFERLQSDDSMRYIREKFLGLRSYYDSAAEKAAVVVKARRRAMLEIGAKQQEN